MGWGLLWLVNVHFGVTSCFSGQPGLLQTYPYCPHGKADVEEIYLKSDISNSLCTDWGLKPHSERETKMKNTPWGLLTCFVTETFSFTLDED